YDRNGVIFIHIPKCGGTSITSLLYGNSPWHFSAQQVRNINRDKFETCYRFSIVRNPWARLYSIYRYAAIEDAQHLLSPLLFISRHRSFEEFVERGLSDYFAQNFHFIRPQTSFLMIDGALAMHAVLKLETVDKDFATIADRFPQFSRPIPRL